MSGCCCYLGCFNFSAILPIVFRSVWNQNRFNLRKLYISASGTIITSINGTVFWTIFGLFLGLFFMGLFSCLAMIFWTVFCWAMIFRSVLHLTVLYGTVMYRHAWKISTWSICGDGDVSFIRSVQHCPNKIDYSGFFIVRNHKFQKEPIVIDFNQFFDFFLKFY